jgi:hypothetical protein
MVMSELNRAFETIPGNLSFTHLPVIDWENKDELQELFPSYRREYLALEKANKLGKSSGVVDIDGFSLMTPLKDKKVFVGTRLHIEANKRCAVYGPNGSGKTLLFHAIANNEIRDFPKHISAAMMDSPTEAGNAPTAEDMDGPTSTGAAAAGVGVATIVALAMAL